MHRRLLLATLGWLLVGVRAAEAEEPTPPETPAAQYWETERPTRDYRQGMRMAVVGVGITAIGVPCALVGTGLLGLGAWGQNSAAIGAGFVVATPGYIAVLAGPPTMLTALPGPREP